MSVFSDTEIRHAITQGHIVCDPLIEENIRGSSIDLTLGEWFYWCGKTRTSRIYNPFSREDVARYFGEPLRARPLQDPLMHKWYGYDQLDGIPSDHPIIMLPARTRILAHTYEFVGIHAPGTTEMRARSSWGRNGIAVCLCAGWGDPGYINRWTMEIHNMNDSAVPLPVGERVAQLIFHHTGPVDGDYAGGKYQSSTALSEIIEQWTPYSMLPKSYKDQRRLPYPLSVEVSS